MAADKTTSTKKVSPPLKSKPHCLLQLGPIAVLFQSNTSKPFAMATATLNLSSLPGKPNKKGISLAPERERYMQACADVAHHLIQLHEEDNGGKDVNLNALRGQISKKYKLKMIPPLTAIIAAIPEHYKKYIVPKLIAKPIRMPHSSSFRAVHPEIIADSPACRYKFWYSRSCCHVQASQVPTYSLRKYPFSSFKPAT